MRRELSKPTPEQAARIREARGTLKQEDVRDWLAARLSMKIGDTTVGKWEKTTGNHPRYEMEAAFALLTGCNLHWLRCEPNAPRTHPRLDHACRAVLARADECHATTAAERVLWCLAAADAAGVSEALGPIQVGLAIHHACWTIGELRERLADRQATWVPFLCSRISLPQRWLETGSPDALAAWRGRLADRVLDALLSSGIDPERFILALPEVAANIRRVTK